jgi:hypothetical protein
MAVATDTLTLMTASSASSVFKTDAASSSSFWNKARVKNESTKLATAERDIFKLDAGEGRSWRFLRLMWSNLCGLKESRDHERSTISSFKAVAIMLA